jgi:hypothetical protein
MDMCWSESLHVLANPYRCRILLALTKHNPRNDDGPDITQIGDTGAELFDLCRCD